MDIISLARRHVIPEVSVVGVYAVLFLGAFGVLGLYKRRIWLAPPLHMLQILKGCAVLILGYLLLQTLVKVNVFIQSRRVILIWAALLTVGMCAHRLLLFPFLLRVASRAGLQRRVVLIGDSLVAQDFLHRLSQDKTYSMLVPVGILTDKTEPLINQGIPRLGKLSDLPGIVELYNLEGAIITDPQLSHDALMSLLEQCISLFGWVDVHSTKSAVWHEPALGPDTYFDIPFVRLSTVPRNQFYLHYKRMTDAFAALLGLIVLSPLLAAVAILVKRSSPGPVFFTRERIGEGGRPFRFYKFRSMRVEAEHDTSRKEAIFKLMKDDSAVSAKVVNASMITPIGRFIRKWALDEIPQLWNVVKGDMSLVGPRPLPPEEYDAQDEWQKKRFQIKPGCTGLWKVMVARHEGISFSNTALYDLYYARNMSPLLDLDILLSTVFVILRGKADG
ncbi:MAG: exopolysaccharide biosynthesis polyprenyl glycosylphosphotransferase [Kiritimatiellae bacterium]|nr:exopolysaccharide biosynthesis polyprenyl glycosylphosphotransferase [Kiritimatiellia bacterium]